MEGANTKRLMIQQMVLENFKSYAGAQTVGPFHKCFSSVVGPNGSGKSNVIDAMLFVFGRRAKQLRFNKVSELIHNSTYHRNLERAQVTVHFQEIIDKDDDSYDAIPGSQFTVARTANRNNTSDYYVNGKKVPVKEVTTLLKEKGIDLDNNRFLILQGEVEQISLMKPKAEDKNDTGLLEYLEDIIGTDQLIPQIEEAGKSLEGMNEGRQAMIAKLKAVEKEKEALEGKKLEAEAYMAKQAERLRQQLLASRLNSHAAAKRLADAEGKSKEFRARLEHEKAKFKSFDAELKAMEGETAKADAELQKVQKELEAAHAEFKEFELKDTKLRMDRKHLVAKAKKLAEKKKSDAEAEAKLVADAARMEEEGPRAAAALEQLIADVAHQEQVLEVQLDGIKEEVEGHHKKMAKVRAELAPWESQMAEVQSRIDVATSERDLLADTSHKARTRLQDATAALAAAKEGAEAKGREITELEAAIKAALQDAAAAREALAAAAAKETALEAEAAGLRGRVGALRSEAAGARSQGAVVRALMEAKRSGAIAGVYGRLGDLGAIDAKYDIAASTSCSALDYIVVDTTSDAQRAVELLRKGELGVATFLILEKQRALEREMNQQFETPEGAPRLFDLVRVSDPKLRVAWWFALRNTLVAKDLAQATRLAYGADRRFGRVVTLEGQLIAESGTMSGGGSKPRGGRMCLGSAAPRADASDAKAAAAELAAAEKALAKAEAALRAARDDKERSEAALKAADSAVARLEVALPKARKSADAKAAEAADLQARLAELEAATKVRAEDASRTKELEKQLSNENVALAKLRASAAGLQKQAAALQDKIDGAGGEKLRKQRALVATLQKKISDAEAEAAKRAVQSKAGAKQLDKLRKDMAKQEAEHQKVEASIAEAMAGLKDMEGAALAVMQRVEHLQADVAAKAEALAEVRARKEEKQQQVGIIRGVEVEIEAALDKLKQAAKDENVRIKALAKALEADAAKLKEYSDEPESVPSEEELEVGNADECLFQVTVLEEQLRGMSPDLEAIAAYRAKEADFAARQAELKAATEARDEVRRTYECLRKQRLDGFMEGFNAISLKLKEMYQMITLGGDAELELVDTLDPFSEGIVFSVRPPKKSWKHIANLSGGEKTLSSLSLVFALHHYKPTPLYVMDEIDAALDFKNVSIVGHCIKERTKNAQFVIISLRNNMFELADRLVGIYKTDNATKTVTINPGEFVVGQQAQRRAGGQQEARVLEVQQPQLLTQPGAAAVAVV